MVHVHTQKPNEPSLGAGAHVRLGLALTPKSYVVVCLCDDRMIGDTFREHVRILTSKERRLRATTDRTRQGNPRPKTEILTPHTNYTTARRAQSMQEQPIFHFPLNFHSRSRDHYACMSSPKVHLRTEEVRLFAVKDRACLTFFGNHCAEFNRSTTFIHPRQHAPLSS
jgi:hypothetical protein